MSKNKFVQIFALCCFAVSTHAFSYTLGEVEDDQGALARAKVDADIADAQAKTRMSSAMMQTPDPDKPTRPSLPARDFVANGFYQFGKRACADLLFRDVLYTRCLGDADGLDGWKLTTLTHQKAVFAKGSERSIVVIGLATASPEANTPSADATSNADRLAK